MHNIIIFCGETVPSGAGSPDCRGFTITLRKRLWLSDQLNAETYT